MTQFRRMSRSGRVVCASAAILALSLVAYGNAATASAPTPLAFGAEPASDTAGPTKGEPATVTDGGGIAKGEDSGKPPAAGQARKVVAEDCWVGAPTTVPPDAPLKLTKDGGRPMPTTQTDPSMGGRPAPSAQTEPSMGARSAPGVGTDGGKNAKGARPDGVVLPELREGPNGVKGFVAPAIECSAPAPVAQPPVTKLPPVKKLPTVTTCLGPPTDPPLGSAGGSPAQPNPGAVAEPDDAQPEDQAVDSPVCVQSDGDDPVSSPGDEGPPEEPGSVASDTVAAQESGDSVPTR